MLLGDGHASRIYVRQVRITSGRRSIAGDARDGETAGVNGDQTYGADGARFTAKWDLQMDLMVPAGELEEAIMSDYLRKGRLIEVTYAELQAATRVQCRVLPTTA